MSSVTFLLYLFFHFQCADDFNTGRVWDLYKDTGEINIEDVDSVNKNVLYILIGSACYKIYDVAVSFYSKL